MPMSTTTTGTRSADAAVVALAEDAKSRSLDDQIKLLHGSEVEAAAAGISYPRFTPRLAQLLAEPNAEPLTWIDVLVRRGASADLLLPFLQRSVEVDAVGMAGRVGRVARGRFVLMGSLAGRAHASRR